MSETTVKDNPDLNRFEAYVDGQLAGFAAYRLSGGHLVFTHTEVDDAYEGQGVGSDLAQGALDQVRAAGEHDVVVMCPFIAAWIERHPDYQDLVAP